MAFIYDWKNMNALVDILSSLQRRELPYNAHYGGVAKANEAFISTIRLSVEFAERKFDTQHLIVKVGDLVVTKDENSPSV